VPSDRPRPYRPEAPDPDPRPRSPERGPSARPEGWSADERYTPDPESPRPAAPAPAPGDRGSLRSRLSAAAADPKALFRRPTRSAAPEIPAAPEVPASPEAAPLAGRELAEQLNPTAAPGSGFARDARAGTAAAASGDLEGAATAAASAGGRAALAATGVVPPELADRIMDSRVGRALSARVGTRTAVTVRRIGYVVGVGVLIFSFVLLALFGGFTDTSHGPRLDLASTYADALPDGYAQAYRDAAERWDVPAGLLAALGERTGHGRYSPYDNVDRDPDRPDPPNLGQAPFGLAAAPATGPLALPPHRPGDNRTNRAEFAAAYLRALDLPVTAENLRFIVSWMHIEGHDESLVSRNNPMNTSLVMPNSHTINSHGVRAYASIDDGFVAAVRTLKTSNPAYGYLRAMEPLKRSDIAEAIRRFTWESSYCYPRGCYQGGRSWVAMANRYATDPSLWAAHASFPVGTGPLTAAATDAAARLPDGGAAPGYDGAMTAMVAEAPVPGPQPKVPADEGEVYPVVDPPIGQAATNEGLGPFLISSSAADEEGLDPQDVTAAADAVARWLSEARDKLVEAGAKEPAEGSDPAAAVEFWAKALAGVPVVDDEALACPGDLAGRAVSDLIQMIFPCELAKVEPLLVTSVERRTDKAGRPTGRPSYQVASVSTARRRLADEALAVAHSYSAMGSAPCDPAADFAGVFPVPKRVAARYGLTNRCDPVQNITAAARAVAEGEAVRPARRSTAAGPYAPAWGGWAELGPVLGSPATQADFAAHGRYEPWAPTEACRDAVVGWLYRIAGNPKAVVLRGLDTTDEAARNAYLMTNHDAILAAASTRAHRDPRRAADATCRAVPGDNRTPPASGAAARVPWSGGPQWQRLVADTARLIADKTLSDSEIIPDGVDPEDVFAGPVPAHLDSETIEALRSRQSALRGLATLIDVSTASTRAATAAPVVGVDALVDRFVTRDVENKVPLVAPPRTGADSWAPRVAGRAAVIGALFDGQDLDALVEVPAYNRSGPGFGPDGCPTTAPASHLRGLAPTDIAALCAKSVAQARTPQAAAAIKFAMSQIGQPYCNGMNSAQVQTCHGDTNRFGRGPARGYDCSGFVHRAYQEAGVDLGSRHTVVTTQQVGMPKGIPIARAEARPGDLVSPGSRSCGHCMHHISMVLADGWKVHASGTNVGVIVSRIPPNETVTIRIDPTKGT